MNAHLRVSDRDRQSVIDALTLHTAEGRLSLDEFADRAAAVYQSKTFADLATITADLPGTDTRQSAAHRPVRLVAATAMLLAVFFGVVVSVAGLGWTHMDTMMASMSAAMTCR